MILQFPPPIKLTATKLSAVRILDKVKLIENILICLLVSAIWFQLPRSEETLRDRMGAKTFSLFTSISSKLEWIFPKKKR
jgi:hypothetical protein